MVLLSLFPFCAQDYLKNVLSNCLFKLRDYKTDLMGFRYHLNPLPQLNGHSLSHCPISLLDLAFSLEVSPHLLSENSVLLERVRGDLWDADDIDEIVSVSEKSCV